MENTEQTSVEQSTPAAEVSAPEASAPAAEQQEQVASPDAAQAVAESIQYQPEFKYKFEDQEKELDAFWRPLIKDKESNKKVLEVVQMAEALPRWRQTAKEAEDTVETVKQLSELFQKGDHERVLEALGYKDEVLFDLVRQKLERSKLPPEQKAVLDEKRRLQLENEKLLADNSKYQTTAQLELARRTDFELDMELSKADYRKVVDAYDGAYGSGAFKKRVVQTGDAMVRSLARHVSPAELLETVMRDYAPFLSQPSAPQVPQPKVIPQVSGGNGSPGKKAVTSLADLKRIREQMIDE